MEDNDGWGLRSGEDFLDGVEGAVRSKAKLADVVASVLECFASEFENLIGNRIAVFVKKVRGVGKGDVGESVVGAAAIGDFGELIESIEHAGANVVGEDVLDKRGKGGGLEKN